MSNENFLDIPKTDETQQPTPEEYYFSKSKNQWIMVSDMSDMHVRRAFKRLLRMIRLNASCNEINSFFVFSSHLLHLI